MVYLFWAFAVVWIGIMLYLYTLIQRSRALERQVAELLERSGGSPRARSSATGRRSRAGLL